MWFVTTFFRLVNTSSDHILLDSHVRLNPKATIMHIISHSKLLLKEMLCKLFVVLDLNKQVIYFF